jgi:PAS domain S-box-containing protein
MIRILVVDDFKEILDMSKYILETNKDFSVDTALSVQDALELIQKNQYDIIISDYYMPDITGLDFLKTLRSFDKKTPFVLQTGQGDETIAMDSLKYGADFFLEKGREGSMQFLEFTQIINLIVLHKRTAQRLSLCNLKFKSLFSMFEDGVILFDYKGHIQDVNQAFLTMTGYRMEEICNIDYHDIIPKEWEDKDITNMKEQVLSRGYSDEILVTYNKKDGSLLPITLKAQLVDNNDKSAGIWVLIRQMLI